MLGLLNNFMNFNKFQKMVITEKQYIIFRPAHRIREVRAGKRGLAAVKWWRYAIRAVIFNLYKKKLKMVQRVVFSNQKWVEQQLKASLGSLQQEGQSGTFGESQQQTLR